MPLETCQPRGIKYVWLYHRIPFLRILLNIVPGSATTHHMQLTHVLNSALWFYLQTQESEPPQCLSEG